MPRVDFPSSVTFEVRFITGRKKMIITTVFPVFLSRKQNSDAMVKVDLSVWTLF